MTLIRCVVNWVVLLALVAASPIWFPVLVMFVIARELLVDKDSDSKRMLSGEEWFWEVMG